MAASGSHAKGGNGGESDEAAREALLNEVNALADAMAETKRSLEAERDELAAALAEARAAAAATATAAAASANTPSGGASADAVSEPMRPRSGRSSLVAPMQVHCDC
jgi:peptidoglycan hydrolase CwlO-like protein